MDRSIDRFISTSTEAVSTLSSRPNTIDIYIYLRSNNNKRMIDSISIYIHEALYSSSLSSRGVCACVCIYFLLRHQRQSIHIDRNPISIDLSIDRSIDPSHLRRREFRYMRMVLSRGLGGFFLLLRRKDCISRLPAFLFL